MKINDLNPSALSGLNPGSISSTSAIGAYGRSGRSGYGSSSDQVQLSGASRVASADLAAHSARLAQLKNQVASGSYDPSPDEVAASLLNEVLAGSA